MNAILDAALKYKARGLAPVPLYPRTKKPFNPRHPQGKEWQKLQANPLPEDEIEAVWKGTPDANVGVLLAGASGIDVLDIDPRHFNERTPPEIKAMLHAPEKVGVPYNLTGGGGAQFFFRRAENLVGQLFDTTSIYPGVEWYAGSAHNFVFAPSVHPDTGKPYVEGVELIPSRLDETLADQLPALAVAIHEALKSRQDRGAATTEHAGNGVVEKLTAALVEHWPMQSSHRHGLALGFAGWAAKQGVPKAHAASVIERVARGRSDDELPDRVRAVQDSYEKHSRGEEIKGASALPPDLVRALREAVRTNGHVVISNTTKPVEIISADELLKLKLPEPRWAVPGILSQGATIMGGKPKIGKSWLALGISIAVASGGMALGNVPVLKGEVLHLALEDTRRRLQDRLNRLIPSGIAPAGLHLATSWPRLNEGGLEEIQKWISAHPLARLIVVDTIERVRPLRSRNGNSYAEDYAAVCGLKGVVDTHNLSALFNHHLKKGDSEDVFDLISGTLGLTGAADAAIVLKRARGQADATLHVTGRDVPESELALKWSWPAALWSILGDAQKCALSKERTEVLRVLVANKEPMAPKEVAEALDKKQGAVKVLMWSMAKDGELKALGNGRYTPNLDYRPNPTDTTNPANPVGPVSGVSGNSREPGE